MILTEKTLRKVLKNLILEYQVNSDTKELSGGEGDPYTYKISGASDSDISIKIVKKNDKPAKGSFKIDQTNKDKPGVKKLLSSIKQNIGEYTSDFPKIEDAIKKLAPSEDSREESNDSKAKSSSDWNPPSNLTFEKKWDELQVRDWFNSTEDVIGAIKYENKTYFAWGYVEAEMSEGVTAHGLAALVPYDVFRKMRDDLGNAAIKLIPQDKAVRTVKPNRGRIKLQTRRGDVPILIKKGTPNIILGTSEFESGAALTADYVMQVLDVIGAFPYIGAGGDAANVLVQLSYKPPLYFGAALSALGIIPAIGELTAGYKILKGVKNFATGAEAGRSLIKTIKAEFPDGMRAVLKNPSLSKIISKNKTDLYQFLRSNSSEISKIIPEFEKILPDFIKYFDDILAVIEWHRNLPWMQLKREIDRFLALSRRGIGSLSEQIDEKLYDSIFASTGLYEAFDIDPERGSPNSRIEKLLLEFSNDLPTTSEEQWVAIDKTIEKMKEKNLRVPDIPRS